ncbi:MAG: hypothetical protein V1916_01125 [Patescibacteria group bacterium]
MAEPMSPQTRRAVIIIGGVVLLAVAAFLVWWFVLRQPAAPPAPTTTNQNQNSTVTTVNAVNGTANQNVNTPSAQDLALVRLANLFAERYGSFSSQSEYQNTLDLKKFMTTRMQGWADAFVQKQRAANTNAAYSAVVTKVVTTTVQSQTEAAATVLLTTQRTESGAATNSEQAYYQPLQLKLVAEGGTWLVDEATWQPKQAL